MRRDWWAPLTGAAFVAVAIISFAVGGEPPDADEPVREIVDHYRDDKDAIQISCLLGAIAAALLVFFGAILRRALALAERDAGGVLPAVAFAGSVILAVGVTIDVTLAFAISEAAGDVDPTAIQAMQAIWDNDFFPLALGSALLLLASGLSIVRSGALPVWLGWVAIVLGVAGLTPAGFVAFVGGAVWIVIVSVMLALRARSAPPPVGAV